METLVTLLEHRQNNLPTTEEEASFYSNVTVDAEKWSKSQVFKTFRASAQSAVIEVRQHSHSLLQLLKSNTIDSKAKYILSHLTTELSILTKLIERFITEARVGADNLGSFDENGFVSFMNRWYNLTQLRTKLSLLLRYVASSIQPSVASESNATTTATATTTTHDQQNSTPTELKHTTESGEHTGQNGVLPNFSAYLSHGGVRSFWSNNFGMHHPTVIWREFSAAIGTELESEEVLDLSPSSPLAQRLCSLAFTVSIFRLEDLTQSNGLCTTFALYRGELSAGTLSTSVASLISTIDVAKLEDIDELSRLQKKIGKLLTMQEEQLSQLDLRYADLLALLVSIDPLYVNAVKDAITNDHKFRATSERAAKQQLENLCKSIVNKQMQLQAREQLARKHSEESNSSSPGTPHSIIMGSKNLTVVMEKIRKSSDTEMPQARITDIVTKLTEVEPVKAPDNNVRKALGVRPEDKFLFACSTRCISPGDVFPQIGTLFVFERLLSFQRTFWQNPALTFPFSKIQRVVKSRISFPPFFDVAIQIQMVDKGVSHHIGPLDHRDLVFDLIMALIRHNAAPDSTNSDTLIGLGLIVVEDVYENERAGLFRGFGTAQLDRGHYTDEEGNIKLKDNLKLPSAEWRWISPWQLDRHHAHVDEDGWEYAVGWRTTWGERTPTTFVRRRKWIRKRMLLPNASDKTHRPAHLGQEIELFDDDGKPTGKFYL